MGLSLASPTGHSKVDVHYCGITLQAALLVSEPMPPIACSCIFQAALVPQSKRARSRRTRSRSWRRSRTVQGAPHSASPRADRLRGQAQTAGSLLAACRLAGTSTCLVRLRPTMSRRGTAAPCSARAEPNPPSRAEARSRRWVRPLVRGPTQPSRFFFSVQSRCIVAVCSV